jgi:hypothetical protein
MNKTFITLFGSALSVASAYILPSNNWKCQTASDCPMANACCLNTVGDLSYCFTGVACDNVTAPAVVEPVEEENNIKCSADGTCPFSYMCCIDTVGDLGYCFTGVACDNVTSSVFEPIKEENNWDCNSTYGCPL